MSSSGRFAFLFPVLVTLAVTSSASFALDDPTPSELAARDDPSIVASETFLNGHPDLKWRAHAIQARDEGRGAVAFTYFRRAARYADKASQAMLAEMLWNGDGVEVNRPLAYVWMDLAAERGREQFAAWRELYWAQLTEAERKEALRIGPAIHDEYADHVAKRRQEGAMRRARQQITGSRTGYVGFLSVQSVVAGQYQGQVDGALFYDPKYWEPEQYWDWQDEIWDQLPKGIIEVLPLQPDTDYDSN